eukprot:GEMP01007147.1.p1 GENE.GEMP01007147.1~~GEMP01007147.1.p1  ORF type:complete len:558 (+),score=108.16 GEMP01007147.1:103-1776(+)
MAAADLRLGSHAFPDGASDGPLVRAKLEELLWLWLNSTGASNIFRDMRAGIGSGMLALSGSPRTLMRAAHEKAASPPARGDKFVTMGPSALELLRNAEALESQKLKSHTMHNILITLEESKVKEEKIPAGAFARPSIVPSGGDSAETVQCIRVFLASLPKKRVTQADQLEPFLTDKMGMSRFLSHVLFQKITLANALDLEESDGFGEEEMINWAKASWDPKREVLTFFYLMKSTVNNWIEKNDFRALMDSILQHLGSLEFLKSSPEFQQRFAETVISRIFFHFDRQGSGRITYRKLRNSLSHETDFIREIKILENDEAKRGSNYFSYEQFYVIYCSFWEIDSDHDFLLAPENIMKYDNHAISRRAVESMFSQAPRKFTSLVPGRMGYEDFTYFLICHHDRSSDISIAYWFRVMDLDLDGVIRLWEMKHFFEEQITRMEGLQYESLNFVDVVCQVHDLILPEKECEFTLTDFRRHRHGAATFFSLFLSLSNLLAFEHRDPFFAKMEDASEWNSFCHHEYMRLANDEFEGGNGSDELEGGNTPDEAAPSENVLSLLLEL